MYQSFDRLDELPLRDGYVAAIDGSQQVVHYLYKTAEIISEDETSIPRLLGGLAHLWRSPELERAGINLKPSSLGQLLVLGSLGALAGYGTGKVIDRFSPQDSYKASRVGAGIGALIGATPGLVGAGLNLSAGWPAMTESFYSQKEASFGDDFFKVYGNQPNWAINLAQSQQELWQNDKIPITLKAYTSGLLNAAATLPGKRTSTNIVTPIDIARVAVGLGTGVASATLVGNAMGALFGTNQKVKDMLKTTGAAIGVLRSIVPVAYAQEPFSLG